MEVLTCGCKLGLKYGNATVAFGNCVPLSFEVFFQTCNVTLKASNVHALV